MNNLYAVLLTLFIVHVLSGCTSASIQAAKRYDVNHLKSLAKTPGVDFNEHLSTDSYDSSAGKDALLLSVNCPRCLRAILNKSAEPKVDIGSKGQYGVTALHLAARFQNKESMNIILNAARKIDAGKGGFTFNSQGNLKEFVNSVSSDLFTPLCYAAHHARSAKYRKKYGPNNIEIYELLIEAGADVNANCFNGRRAIDEAILNEAFKVADVLIKHGADIWGQNGRGNTPLHTAAKWGKVKSIKWLTNKVYADYVTGNNSRNVKQALIQKYLNITNSKGWTPYFVAVRRDNNKAANLLVSLGANTNTVDHFGNTAYDSRDEYSEEVERDKAKRNNKKASESSSDLFMKALVLAAGASQVNRSDLSSSDKADITTAFAKDVISDTGGTNLNSLSSGKNSSGSARKRSQDQAQQQNERQREITHTYTCPASGKQQKRIVIPYRDNACLEVKKEFAEVMACNMVDDFKRVKNNCSAICGHPQCLE